MGDLITIEPKSTQRSADLVRALRALADRVEANPKPLASYGVALVYTDGTVGLEFYGSMLTTLVGAAELLKGEIVRDL